jgi:hypothetical protein
MRLPLIGRHRCIFIGNLGLCWVYFDRIIANAAERIVDLPVQECINVDSSSSISPCLSSPAAHCGLTS